MWARLATVALCLAGVTAHAQSANDSGSRLQSCIEAARLAEAICSKIPDDPMSRANCFAKARATQLECLDRVLSEAPAETTPPGSASKTALPEPPIETAQPRASAERPASNETGRTGQPDVSAGSNAADEAARLSDAAPKPAPPSVPPPEALAPIGAMQSSETGRSGQPDVSAGSNAAHEAARLSDVAPKAAPPSVPPPEAAAPTGAIQSRETGRTGQPNVSAGSNADEAAKLSDAAPNPAPPSVPPLEAAAPTRAIHSTNSETKIDGIAANTGWIVSETTSPVDYGPLVTAVISSASNPTDGPNTLTIRCRARHTDLSIRTNGAWDVRRGNELLIDHQINDRPVVRQPWILSTDGKTATYKNDSVEFLRSIPEGATLKIAVAEKSNVGLAATFELPGLSVIRQKVGTACKWAPLTAKTSSEKP